MAHLETKEASEPSFLATCQESELTSSEGDISSSKLVPEESRTGSVALSPLCKRSGRRVL